MLLLKIACQNHAQKQGDEWTGKMLGMICNWQFGWAREIWGNCISFCLWYVYIILFMRGVWSVWRSSTFISFCRSSTFISDNCISFCLWYVYIILFMRGVWSVWRSSTFGARAVASSDGSWTSGLHIHSTRTTGSKKSHGQCGGHTPVNYFGWQAKRCAGTADCGTAI